MGGHFYVLSQHLDPRREFKGRGGQIKNGMGREKCGTLGKTRAACRAAVGMKWSHVMNDEDPPSAIKLKIPETL